MAFDKQKFLTRFVDEAKEHIKNLNQGLLILEKNPDDSETLNGVFRSAHTIKGSSRMMKLLEISDLAHKLEDTLDSLRQRRISQSEELFDLLFTAIETVGQMLDSAKSGTDIPEAADLCQKLEKAAEGRTVATGQASSSDSASEETAPEAYPDPPGPLPSDSDPGKTDQEEQAPSPVVTPPSFCKETEKKIPKNADTIRVRSDKLDDLIKLMGEIMSGYSREKYRLAGIADAEKLAKQVSESAVLMNDHPDAGVHLQHLASKAQSLYSVLNHLAADIREDMNSKRLILSDLQDTSLKMRMLPLSTIFDAFRISVRNLSRSFGKDVELVIEGDETELDKKIIEKIGDPILHMIRNSIDHGIETAQERTAAGKPVVGTIRLSAEYEGGMVLIKISDDGAGIPVQKIRNKAVKKNILRESALQNISDAELINLIFHPGFSTSDIITDISGRGVGMDVVKQNIIDHLKGSIQIVSEAGKGTTFFIRLPMTMAIIRVLMITAGNMTFAIPANHIDEIVRVSSSDIIDVISSKAVRLRNQLIPIVPLKDILALPAGSPETVLHDGRSFLTLIASAVNEKLGIVIDALFSEEDIVVKPLPPLMKNAPFVSGAIISDNNRIINVLHMPKIIDAAREVSIRTEAPVSPSANKQLQILLVEDSYSTREIEKSILESYGYRVSLAEDGLDGLEKAKQFQYDLVITDVEMPRMNGFLLAETLKKTESYKDVPIILVTSLDKKEDKKRGIEVGADAYIVKGAFDQSTLIDSVRNLVG